MNKILQALGIIFLVLIIISFILGLIFALGFKEYKDAEAYCTRKTKKLFNQFLDQAPKDKNGSIQMHDFSDFYKVENFMTKAYVECMREKGVPDSMIRYK